ncbi:DUF2279 domain-containing protein [Rhodocytophaga rosea]|uniref:DUF2279 domain-containing protein n=2 Tax=Rhodocytophaga rosea TaxID=2704465 RepID=A0A6C0GVW1_9BACT|nr:DUF2279 domain-containing protein [Rhodocytophaga rosea]
MVYIGASTVYAGSLLALNEIWYKESPRTNFHFFNDNAQWLQIDKVGHFYSAYHLSHTGARIFRWTGMDKQKATWLGAATGMVLLIPIEFLDGFSAEYGASWGDLLANSTGVALSLQNLLWQEPRIHPKFSFHQTSLASMRPNVLGENLPQQMIKDYNGQTYWLAFDIQPWLRETSKFPSWLGVALGYGGEQMVYARSHENQSNGYDSYRQYYLSLDINLTRIRVKNKFLKSLFFALNTIHIPAPALEWNRKQGFRVHALYF